MSCQTSWPLSPLFVFVQRSQLLTSSAVHKWGTEIHEGIYNMLMLLVELVAERVKQDPVPVNLMGVLTMVRTLAVFVLEMHQYPVAHTRVTASHSRSLDRFVCLMMFGSLIFRLLRCQVARGGSLNLFFVWSVNKRHLNVID